MTMERKTMNRELFFLHTVCQDKIKVLESQLAAAKDEILRLSGVTNYCLQCEQWAKEFAVAKETNTVLHAANEEYKVNVQLMLKENAAAKADIKRLYWERSTK